MNCILTALIVAIGITAMGFFVGEGLRHIKSNERFVNVRGLSEREVTADTARLEIAIRYDGNDPVKVFPRIGTAQDQVVEFLKQAGLKEDEIEIGQWVTTRTDARDIKDDPSIPRYAVSGGVNVTTHNVNAVAAAYKKINDLRVKTDGGVAHADVVYAFTGLGGIKAEMIADATKNARNAALQFAQDSGSDVGSIRNASQGLFEILVPGRDSDDPQSIRKNVRVVTTVDYELRD